MPISRMEAERADFDSAVIAPDKSSALEMMMKLSLQAVSPALRNWATKWLKENFNVKVVNEDQNRASKTPANDIH